MRVISMPNCCAVKVIAGFGHTPTDGDLWAIQKFSEKEIYEFLIANTKIHYIYKIYINAIQHKKIGKAITKAGFRRTIKMHHKRHQNMVYEYTKIVM